MKANPKSNELTLVTTRKERKQFVNFPYKHYRSDNYWVAPLKSEQKKLVDRENNPFFENAEMAMFLVRQNGTVCGRIAAIEDRRFNDHHNTNIGFFGFFESIEDQSVANLLIQAALGWLQDRGLDKIMGPASPSMMDEIGVLVDGFDKYPAILMPYSKPYYDDLLKTEGFKKEMDLLAFRVTQDDVPIERMRRAKKIVHKRYPGLQLRQVDMDNLEREVQIVRDIFNQAWSQNWGFIPLTEAELGELADEFKMILDPKYAHIAEIDNKPIGFSVALPDLNQALRHMNGRLFPFGIFKLLWYRRNINMLRTVLMGVVPEHRGKGIEALFNLKAIENGRKYDIYGSELSWVLETNQNMVRVAERLGAEVEKRYRMYSKEL